MKNNIVCSIYIEYAYFKEIPHYLLDLGFRFTGEWNEEQSCMQYTVNWKYPVQIIFSSIGELMFFLEKRVNNHPIKISSVSGNRCMITIDNFREMIYQWEYEEGREV